MQRDHTLYGRDVRIGVAFAEERVIHLLRGWVFPVAVAGAFGDGGGFAGGREGYGLVGGGGLGNVGEHVV